MSERKLATIQVIEKIDPIEGKDRIGLATMVGLGWHVIVNKEDIKVGDKVVYFEIDSILDSNNLAFEFMAKRKFRVKTLKMAGVVSQGLCIPASVFGEENSIVGKDLTDKLKVQKYDPEAVLERSAGKFNDKEKHSKLVKFLLRFKWFRILYYLGKLGVPTFPSEVSKTDECRVQNKPCVLKMYNGRTINVSEKVDGCSSTFLLKPSKSWFGKKYDYIVCSRNLQVNETGNTVYAEVSRNYDMEGKLTKLLDLAKDTFEDAKFVAIQGEILAPNVQGNKYHKNRPELYVFNIIVGTSKGERLKLGNKYVTWFCDQIGLTTVPMLPDFTINGQSVDDMVELSKFKSSVYDTLAEGKVYRVTDDRGMVIDSFKVINPDFLIKYGD